MKQKQTSDTDSLTIATSKTHMLETDMYQLDRKTQMEAIFLPIVQPNKLEEFKLKWNEWLCLSNQIEEEKTTGKLKIEFLTFNGRMISLSPKSYFCLCKDTLKTKDGRKGVPNWWDLRLLDFESTLYRKAKTKPIEVKSLRLSHKTKKMKRTTTRRVGLTAIHVKLGMASDLITCQPLTKNNQLI